MEFVTVNNMKILKFVTASLFWIILEHIFLLFYCFLLKEQPLVS